MTTAGTISTNSLGTGAEAGYATNIFVTPVPGGAGSTAYAKARYVTASGEIHWIFALYEKGTGKLRARTSAPDHVIFGNRGVLHPFRDYDPAKHEIVVVNPSMSIIEEIEFSRAVDDPFLPEKSFFEQFDELYEINESKQEYWPDIPITVGLPRKLNGKPVDYRFLPMGTIVTPIKKVIPRPAYITPLALRAKAMIK
jgi:hypothetical protein